MRIVVEACCASTSHKSGELAALVRSSVLAAGAWPRGRRSAVAACAPATHVIVSAPGGGGDAQEAVQVRDCDDVQVALYHPSGAEPEPLFVAGEDSGGDGDTSVASVHWRLPHAQFEGYWDSLVFDEPIKSKILDYAQAMLVLSQHGVDPSIVPVNRLILLHGVPGTGKTTLCKAVAQRLSIRLQRTFPRAVFVVVNSHSLFSKWFSESGKLIQRMFDQINELLLDDKMLVVVLVDEVESIGMCRESALARNEPSDSVRAVNALLTQLDAVARHRNALVLATSNLVQSVDRALLDRADMLIRVPLPGAVVIGRLLRDAFEHLLQRGLIAADGAPAESVAGEFGRVGRSCAGLSGRAVRRLPVRAFAAVSHQVPVTQTAFLDSLRRVCADAAEK